LTGKALLAGGRLAKPAKNLDFKFFWHVFYEFSLRSLSGIERQRLRNSKKTLSRRFSKISISMANPREKADLPAPYAAKGRKPADWAIARTDP
jgi:hypothetical protein